MISSYQHEVTEKIWVAAREPVQAGSTHYMLRCSGYITLGDIRNQKSSIATKDFK